MSAGRPPRPGAYCMGLPIFYFEPEQLDQRSAVVVMEGDDAHHLTGSLRVRPGDRVALGDGRGSVYEALVRRAEADRVELGLDRGSRVDRETPAVRLVQGLCRPTAMDEAVAMAAECGVDTLMPFVAPRSQGKSRLIEQRRQRWQRMAREASMRARRAWPMSVAQAAPWPPALAPCALVLWEDERTASLVDSLPGQPPEAVDIVVGPEGGFSPEDVRALSGPGTIPVSLGRLNIRSASAGSYAAMLVRERYGLLRPGEEGDA